MMSSGGGNDTEKILNAISTARSLGLIGNTDRNDRNDRNDRDDKNDRNDRNDRSGGLSDISVSENVEYMAGHDTIAQNDGIKAVKAAIPFLNREYQKHLFLAVKLIEMNDEFDKGSMNLQCQSIREGSDDEQKESMLRAIRGQIGNESARKLDVVLKMMEAKKIAAKLK
ncbi:hypothetical protein SDC9_209555 [bioreactor metagenome]|uniref:Uncharacterized protein n=1 Tax=bioreactor metagenome TaxID=1076179 RepID=A0A645JDZ6_9ZZZZ